MYLIFDKLSYFQTEACYIILKDLKKKEKKELILGLFSKQQLAM